MMISLVNNTSAIEEGCKFAWPQMGVIECREMGANAYDTYDWDESKATNQNPYHYFLLTCISHCSVSKSDILGHMQCPTSIWFHHEEAKITVQGSGTVQTISSKESGDFSKNWEKGQTLQITEYCMDEVPIGGGPKLLDSAGVTWKENKIKLYETTPDWPQHEVTGSDGCLAHNLAQQYSQSQISSGQPPQNWIDIEGNSKGTLANNFVNLNTLPTNLETGQTYSYFYKWIEVADINVAYDRQGNPAGYCGGSLGNRKFYQYQKVTTQGGSCYLIPTSIQKSVECCYPTDCRFKGSDLTCDTSTFTCSDKKPCDSDIECQADEAACTSKTRTAWTCDLDQPWYPKKGTCVRSTESVECCTSEDCTDTRLYTCSNNKCIQRKDLLSCPSGACCKVGGTYLPQECSAGLQCCILPGAYSGECKQSCDAAPSGEQSAALNNLATQVGAGIIRYGLDNFGNAHIPVALGPLNVEITLGAHAAEAAKSSTIAFPNVGTSIAKGILSMFGSFGCKAAAVKIGSVVGEAGSDLLGAPGVGGIIGGAVGGIFGQKCDDFVNQQINGA